MTTRVRHSSWTQAEWWSQRLIPFAVAVVAAASVACGDTNVTSVRLQIDWDASWELSAFQVEINGRTQELAPTDDVEIWIPDDWAGQALPVRVRALQQATEWAAGEAEVTPKEGQQTAVVLTLLRTECMSPNDCLPLPGPSCADDETERIYTSAECLAGGCVYSFDDLSCAVAPADECVGDALRVYDDSGTCMASACEYTWTDTPCEGGCAEAACIPVCDQSACVAPELLASNQSGIGHMKLDATHIYWANFSGGEIRRMAKSSGNIEDIATDQNIPFEVAVDDDFIYWTSLGNDKVLRRRKDGTGAIITLATSPSPRGIAIDDGFVYWGGDGDTSLRRVAKSGGEVFIYDNAEATDLLSIAVDSTHIYWTAGNVSYRIAKSGGAAEVLATTSVPNGLAVDDTHVYWSTGNGLIERWDKVGGFIEAFANNQPDAYYVTLTSTHVYWGHEFGVRRRLRSGGPIEDIADGQDTTISTALDNEYIYWINFLGDELMRLPLCCL